MRAMTKDELWFKDESDEDKVKAIQEIGREVFSTEKGAIFLSVILDDLRYNTAAVTEREVGLKNYASVLLRDRLGLTGDSLAVTTALLNIRHKETHDAE